MDDAGCSGVMETGLRPRSNEGRACQPLEHRKSKDMTVRRRFRWILFWLQMVPAHPAISL
jgi:hypothetical protein